MNRTAIVACLFATLPALVATAVTAAEADETADRAAVIAVVDQYVSGFYQADEALTRGVCHPQLSKHGVADRYWGQPFEHLDEITYEQLAWLGDHYNHDGRFDPATARKDIRILDLRGDYAQAELIAGDWLDFFHLARLNGEWTIINVVWWGDVPGDGSEAGDDDHAGVIKAATDYIQGYYHVDADRCVSGVHDQLDKRTIRHTDQGDILRDMTREQLHHLAAVGNVGERRVDPATGRSDVKVLQIHGNVAAASLDAETWFDYFHLVKIDGRWVIVNVLWGMHG